MSWRLRLSVETILCLTPAVLGSTVFSIAGFARSGLCAVWIGVRPSFFDAERNVLILRHMQPLHIN